MGATDGRYKGNEDSPGNKTYIRYADVLLWKAEALIQTGEVEAGLTIIDQIRDRAKNTPAIDGTTVPQTALTSFAGTGLSADDALEVLHHERRVELGFESQRLGDLKRWELPIMCYPVWARIFRITTYFILFPKGKLIVQGVKSNKIRVINYLFS